MTEWDIAIKSLKTHWRLISLGILAGLVLALCMTLFQKPVWQAEMIVGATERTGVPSLSSLLPQGAADAPALQLFADRIDAATSSDFTRFETVLNSPQIIEALVKMDNDNTLPSQDSATLQIWLDDHLKIRSFGLTPYRKITLRHDNRDAAMAILGRLHMIADRTVRQDKDIKTKRRIAYLREQLENVRNPDHRDAIISLIKEQEQIAMMVAIDNAFAADMIRPPYVLPKPVAPNPTLLFPLLALSGGLFGLLISGFISAVRR